MKKFIIIAIFLFSVAMGLTALYFSALQPRKQGMEKVMNLIPRHATLVFEYNNDKSFDDIFKNNPLFSSITGTKNTLELTYLRDHFLKQKTLAKYFTDQRIFISLHPKPNGKKIDFLVSTSTIEYVDPQEFMKMLSANNSGFKVTQITFHGKNGYRIEIPELDKNFFLMFDGRLIAGSFSWELIEDAALHAEEPKNIFTRLSDQQISNSVANLYINYKQLPVLLDQVFKDNHADIFQFLKPLMGTASLSLNYKTDAIMFNGFTNLDTAFSNSYLGLFLHQKPFKNSLKNIFPHTTAYSLNFAFADPVQFEKDLALLQNRKGLKEKRNQLFEEVKAKTGVDLQSAFNTFLGNEFAVLTTDRQEKIGLIRLKNGSLLNPYLNNISSAATENMGRFDFDGLPYYLFGDAFHVFRKPYYTVIDNYLLLANSSFTLTKYLQIYNKRAFLNAHAKYVEFDALQADQSNISFFIHVKNATPILNNSFRPAFVNLLDKEDFGWKNYYAASYQFTSSDMNFYTNLYLSYEEKIDSLKNP